MAYRPKQTHRKKTKQHRQKAVKHKSKGYQTFNQPDIFSSLRGGYRT